MLGWVAHGLLVVATLVVVALLVLLVLIPRLMGWVPLTVLSGSMEPAIEVGSQVVVKPVETATELEQVAVGDVISFMPYSNDPEIVTHRVVSQGVRADGRIVLTTRGDANTADDPAPVGLQQIRGVSQYHVPYAGYLASTLDPDQKRTGTVIMAVALFGYAGWNVAAVLRERRHRSEP